MSITKEKETVADRTVSLLQNLFVARDDTYTIQSKTTNGAYEYERRRSALTSQILASHLNGDITIGVYPFADSTTKWLVFDIDVPDANEVIQIKGRLAHHSISGYLEDSGRNWHLWVFFEEPASNRIVRTFAEYILSEANCQNPVEIFPKQDEIEKVGSCIKLPLGINRKTGRACLFVNESLKPIEDQPGFLESIQKTTEAKLHGISHVNGIKINQEAARNTPPAFVEPCIEKYWREGAREGQRAVVAYQIAIRFSEAGFSEENACNRMVAWLERCDKGTQSFTERELFISVYNAYTKKPVKKAHCIHTLLKKNCVGPFNCSFLINLKKKMTPLS